LGFRVEEFGSSGSAGSYFSRKPLPYIPQREAREEITPRRKLGKIISLCKFPRDRPDPREEQPPQDDDPNSSTLNPMSFSLPLPRVSCAKGSFLKNWGWARFADPAAGAGGKTCLTVRK
jgi:hypothetical protein